jgi:LAO/AO transport system kinase
VDLVAKALEGNQLAGARIIRQLEDEDPDGFIALRSLYPRSGRAHIVGVTGPPGAGKSTLVDGLIAELRERDRRVGVIAIDPSSPFTGGAILGDRVRMQRHATDDGVFIRSMATRGALGGLCRAAFETSVVLDAMGYDVILIETVGVGQDELDVVDLAHTTAVLSIPGMGDGIQSMKAGILEIADVFVINKADLPGADDVERQLHTMIALRDCEDGAWKSPLLKTVAEKDEGIPALTDALIAHGEYLVTSNELARKNQQRDLHAFVETLRLAAGERILSVARASADHASLLADLAARRIDPRSAAEALIRKIRVES